jgi:aryl-alcohol dehydrogenase-like predicted oxidoreductase
MEQRMLGTTGIAVTVLGYGAMALRDLDEQQSAAVLNSLLDQGMTLIDTSPDYGMSEVLIGKAIAHRRSEYILATKCGCHHDEAGHHLTPQHIWTRAMLLENIERSLRQLKTDHIDIWQMHSPSPKDLPGGIEHESIQTMLEMKRQGKVRAIGISFPNTPKGGHYYPAGRGYEHIPEMLDYGFDMMQIVYGALTRKCEIAITSVAERGLGSIVRGVVRQYYENYPELFEQAGLPDLYAPGEGMNDFLIRFAISHPQVDSAIIGTGSIKHLSENIQAANRGPLPADVYAEAKRRLDSVGVIAEPY